MPSPDFDPHQWPEVPPGVVPTNLAGAAMQAEAPQQPQQQQETIAQIKRWHTALAKKWDPAAAGYVRDVGLLLKALADCQAKTSPTLPSIPVPAAAAESEGSAYRKGWRAACAWIEYQVHKDLSRPTISRWDVFRMRQGVGEIISLARQQKPGV